MTQGIIVNDKLLKASQSSLLSDLFHYLCAAGIMWSKYGYSEKQFCLAQLSILFSRLLWLVSDSGCC